MGCRNSRIRFKGYGYVQGPPCEDTFVETQLNPINPICECATFNNNNMILNRPPVVSFPQMDINSDLKALALPNNFNEIANSMQLPFAMPEIHPFGHFPSRATLAAMLDQLPSYEQDFPGFTQFQLENMLAQRNEPIIQTPLAMPMFPTMPSARKEPFSPPLAMPNLPTQMSPPLFPNNFSFDQAQLNLFNVQNGLNGFNGLSGLNGLNGLNNLNVSNGLNGLNNRFMQQSPMKFDFKNLIDNPFIARQSIPFFQPFSQSLQSNALRPFSRAINVQ